MEGRAAELAAMSRCAEAIEPLPEATQRRVVQWLAGTFGVELATSISGVSAAEATPSAGRSRSTSRRKGGAKAAEPGAVGPAKPRAKAGAPGHDKTLNLRPADKVSFADFLAEKTPRDRQQEHNVVAVYWLTQIADVEAVTPDQVFTCYRGVAWKLPPDLRNSLQKTAYEKGWLDTQNMDDIKIAPQGLNFVEHDLPPRK